MDPDSLSVQKQEMLNVNRAQRAYYDAVTTAGGFEHTPSGRATRLWSLVRSRFWMFREASGLDERVFELHRRWIGDVSEARILDLGCGDGRFLSFWLAENSKQYTAIDLSEVAVAALNENFMKQGFDDATAVAGDFLQNDFPDDHFDVVYAISVLHHFQHFPVLIQELNRVTKPGGIIVSLDPLKTAPINKILRALYRPMQSDRDWEWPFTRNSFGQIQHRFDIVEIQGLLGMSRIGFPFFLLPRMGRLASWIARRGAHVDNKMASDLNLWLYLCWQVTMVLRKPPS